jgi:Glyoxalase/Bleomycin resistance protein/Dioxygenase superfamily
MNAVDLFHTGIVTDTFDETLAYLTELFGYEWCQEISNPTPVTLPTGEITLDLHFAYSKTAPRLEIIKSVRGTLWTPAEGSGIHHLGYWSADVTADQRRLIAAGFAVEAVGQRPDGAAYWGYYRRPGGHRVELVSRDVQPALEQMWV